MLNQIPDIRISPFIQSCLRRVQNVVVAVVKIQNAAASIEDPEHAETHFFRDYAILLSRPAPIHILSVYPAGSFFYIICQGVCYGEYDYFSFERVFCFQKFFENDNGEELISMLSGNDAGSRSFVFGVYDKIRYSDRRPIRQFLNHQYFIFYFHIKYRLYFIHRPLAGLLFFLYIIFAYNSIWYYYSIKLSYIPNYKA
jgi:hypothetical protein